MILDYGCDICSERTVYENIQWITSSFGVCVGCYTIMSQCEREGVEVKYE